MLQHLATSYRDASSSSSPSHTHARHDTACCLSLCWYSLLLHRYSERLRGRAFILPSKPQSQPSQAQGRSKGLSPENAKKESSALTHAMLCYVAVVEVDLLLIAG